LNNARQLAGAADQYMMETGRTIVPYSALVGSSSYVKFLETVASESYPTDFTKASP